MAFKQPSNPASVPQLFSAEWSKAEVVRRSRMWIVVEGRVANGGQELRAGGCKTDTVVEMWAQVHG